MLRKCWMGGIGLVILWPKLDLECIQVWFLKVLCWVTIPKSWPWSLDLSSNLWSWSWDQLTSCQSWSRDPGVKVLVLIKTNWQGVSLDLETRVSDSCLDLETWVSKSWSWSWDPGVKVLSWSRDQLTRCQSWSWNPGFRFLSWSRDPGVKVLVLMSRY